jgi:hypothetical protein
MGTNINTLSNKVLVALVSNPKDEFWYKYRNELLRRLEELGEIKKCHDCPFCGQRQCMRIK